ncbi:hypothetical protein GCM10010431_84890 [Streptomyces kunmingensis]
MVTPRETTGSVAAADVGTVDRPTQTAPATTPASRLTRVGAAAGTVVRSGRAEPDRERERDLRWTMGMVLLT